MIAVTGVGAVSAFGYGVDTLMKGILEGRTGIRDHAGQMSAVLAGGPHLGSHLALAAAMEAVGDCDRAGLGIVGASTAGDMTLGEPAYAAVLDGEVPTHEFFWTQLCHRPTAQVAFTLGATGPRSTLSNACVSGAAAVGTAMDWIASGRCQAVLAFGVDALCQLTQSGFGSLGLLSGQPARPFDRDRDGICLGDGAGAVLLESVEHALERGAEPIAWLRGYGNAMDSHHMTAPAPDGRGLRAAIDAAVKGPVDYVNAHGTGTPLNDEAEAHVIGDLFPGVPVSSIKGAVGHTLGAAGTLDMVVTIEALRRGVLPPNVGMREPGFDLPFVREATERPLRAALTVNAAFGGSNTALYVERA